VLLDFDGTLAPIVEDPALARPLPGVGPALARLCDRYGVVAVVSGRPVAYLQEHLPAGPTLVGLYGLEEVRDGEVVTHRDAVRWRAVVDGAASAAAEELPPAVGVEHKGLSLTLHVRQHPELASTVQAWAAPTAGRLGLVLRRAKMSVELHPPVDADKGTVVESLLGAVGAACFIGDDVGDLPAFEALARFAAAGGSALALVVESPESDPALLEHADVRLDGPPAVLEVLLALGDG
jgi:trehalose 6-phosphate phosphatase